MKSTDIDVCITSAMCIVISFRSLIGIMLNAITWRFPFIDLTAPVTRAYLFSWTMLTFFPTS